MLKCKEGKMEKMEIFDIIVSLLSIIAFIYAAVTIHMNVKVQKIANQLKRKELDIEIKRNLYDRRLELQNKLLWLMQFPNNWIKYCGLRIERDGHPYYSINDNRKDMNVNDKFIHTILNELFFLSSDVKMLFPEIYDEYMDFYEELQKAYKISLTDEEKSIEIAGSYQKKWENILMKRIPNVMAN